MLVLSATTDTVQGVLAGTILTNQLACYASYRDITTTAYTPGRVETQTNNTTDVNVVTSPAASTQRVVDYLSVYNTDLAAAVVTLKFDAAGVERILWKGTLAVNEKVEYVEGVGWRNFDATGTVKGIGATGAPGVPGGGTVLGTGISQVQMGAFPGTPQGSLVVTGLPLIQAGSLVYCWLTPIDTVDHTADEHLVEPLVAIAKDVIAGTGFTIFLQNTSTQFPPSLPERLSRFSGVGQDAGPGIRDIGIQPMTGKASPNESYGLWSVAWMYTQ